MSLSRCSLYIELYKLNCMLIVVGISTANIETNTFSFISCLSWMTYIGELSLTDALVLFMSNTETAIFVSFLIITIGSFW